MSLRRLRSGEWLAALGAGALVVSLLLPWFGLEQQGAPAGRQAYAPLDLPGAGISQLGWVVVAACLAAVALALWMVLATATGLTGPAVMATVLTVTVSAVAFGLVVLRLALDQPDLGADLPGSAVGVEPAAWVGLAASAALLAGAWRAIADERRDAPDSAYEPPPARPAPPPAPEEPPAPVPREQG